MAERKTLKWGDKLLGKEITPDAWLGGLVEFTGKDWLAPAGQWVSVVTDLSAGRAEDRLRIYLNPTGKASSVDVLKRVTTPIYPPRAWNGKTEKQIYKAMFGGKYANEQSTTQAMNIGDGVEIYLVQPGYGGDGDRRIAVYLADNEESLMLTKDGLKGTIQDMKNALVLAERLGLEGDGK